MLGATINTFLVEPFAGWLMVPYLVWVTVAASLNAAVWWLNPDEANAPRSAEA